VTIEGKCVIKTATETTPTMLPNGALRVLHVGKYFPPPYGGIESVCLSIIDTIKDDVALEFVVSSRNGSSRVKDYKGVSIHELATPAVLASQPLTFGFFVWLRRNLPRFDVVHLHLPNPLACAAVLFALPAHPKVRIMITWHSDVVRQVVIERLLRPIIQSLLRRTERVAAATPAHFSSSKVVHNLASAQRAVVPFFIESARLAPDASEVTAWKGRVAGRRLIAACGRHVSYKGFNDLIEAMQHVQSDALLVLAGEGPLTHEYQAIIKRLKLDETVILAGALPRPQLLGLLNACEVFCLPSVTQAEAFGIAMAEAMSCGKPVVCCELHNGVTALNTHEQTGLVVEPHSPVAIAAAIKRLLDDRELCERLGRQGQARIENEYSATAMRGAMLQMYGVIDKD
jgi:glycosyltransferase involved in cell wall biosynthesis